MIYEATCSIYTAQVPPLGAHDSLEETDVEENISDKVMNDRGFRELELNQTIQGNVITTNVKETTVVYGPSAFERVVLKGDPKDEEGFVLVPTEKENTYIYYDEKESVTTIDEGTVIQKVPYGTVVVYNKDKGFQIPAQKVVEIDEIQRKLDIYKDATKLKGE